MTDALTVSYETLRSWGFASGFYTCFCAECGKHHTADKRAWRCLDCAENHARLFNVELRTAYLRGLEDAAAAVRSWCDFFGLDQGDSLSNTILALAEQARNETD